MKKTIVLGVAILTVTLAACAAEARPPDAAAPPLGYTVVARYPHDTGAFTEGLVYANGKLYESTGLVGHSGVRVVDLKSGRILRQHALTQPYFGEGLTRVGKRLLQLTWTNQQGFLYDEQLNRVGEFAYRGEGWGLTYDGRDELLESDGSNLLHRWSVKDYRPLGNIVVHDGKHPVTMLNELEFVKDRIYANVWLTDDIVAINAANGQVTGWISLTPLRRQFTPPPGWDPSAHVPNGIAWNPANGHLYVTGKCWPTIFEIKLDGENRNPAKAAKGTSDQIK